MIPRDEAIVLRRIRYANTSLVVSYHTRRHGYVSVLAKGARRPRRRGVYDRPPDLFCAGELVWYPRRGGELGIQAEWAETDDHPYLARSLPGVRAATRVVDVLAAISRDAEPSRDLFDQARRSLAALNAAAAVIDDARGVPEWVDRLGMLILHFDLRALDIAGYGPEMTRCVSCGRAPQGARLGFSPSAGGVLCAACVRSAPGPDAPLETYSLPAVAADAARRLRESRIDQVMDVQLTRSAQRALRRAMDASLTYNLERNMRSFRPPAVHRPRRAAVTS